MHSSDRPLASSPHRLAVVACFATMFLMGVAISLLGPSLRPLAERTGVPLAQAGIFFTIYSSGSIVSTLVVARLNDRPARHAVLVAGAFLMAIGHLALAGSVTFLQAAAGTLLSGLALSAIGTAPNAIIADMYRGRTGPALNALHISVGVGAFVGPTLISLAIAAGADYRLVYRGTALAAAGLAVLWLVARPPAPQRVTTKRAIMARRFSLALALVLFLVLVYTGSEQTMGAWLFTFARDAAGTSAAAAGLVVSAFWLAILGGRLLATLALRRSTSERLLAGCILLAALGVGLILLSTHIAPLLWLGVILVGIGFGPVFPTALALTADRDPERAGASGSYMVAAGSAGASFLPLAAGSLIPIAGVAASIGTVLITLFLMLLCVIAIARQPSPHPAVPAHDQEYVPRS